MENPEKKICRPDYGEWYHVRSFENEVLKSKFEIEVWHEVRSFNFTYKVESYL